MEIILCVVVRIVAVRVAIAIVGKCVAAGRVGTGALPIASAVLLSLEEPLLLLFRYSGGHVFGTGRA